MNQHVEGAVDRVVTEGGSLAPDEALMLCEQVTPYSQESYYLQWAAHELLHDASRGKGLLYSQIGIDANPCPGNCWYCSFAACNNNWSEKAELPLDIILEYSRIFSENGVHMISLMATANYSFDQYIDVVGGVRSVIAPNVAIMVNMGDFGLDEARRLKEAGATAVYHAVRVGEGAITSIDPEVRWATIHAAMGAGLRISSGIEPVYRGVDLSEVVRRMYQVAEIDPVCSGIGELVCVEGTKMASFERMSKEEQRILSSVWQLVAGRGKAPFGGANTRWIDAGANPRGTEMLVGEDRIKRDIEQARKSLEDNEWVVPDNDIAFCELY